MGKGGYVLGFDTHFTSLGSFILSQAHLWGKLDGQAFVLTDAEQTYLPPVILARDALMSPHYLHVLRLNQGERFQLKRNYKFFKKSKEKILFSTE